MLSADVFCDELAERGFTVASGVPCSHFSGPIEVLTATPGRYVPAANEGAALAIAAGVALAGGRAYVMLQNSGLGNLINPLTSLIMTYRIPVLTFVSLRGWPDPTTDEPQHEVMGPATPTILDAVGIPHWVLAKDAEPEDFRGILDAAEQAMAQQRAPFVLVQRGAVGKVTDHQDPILPDALASVEVVRRIVEVAEHSAIIATTGYTARELFGVADRPNHFYMQGSMGHACSIGLGVALTRPERAVVVLDGDGAALMHLGSLSAIGHQAPTNLVHVILDNGTYESTGGQCTTSTTTSFVDIGLAAGYRSAVRCTTLDDVTQAVKAAIATPGPHLCVVATLPRTGAMPPRATSALSAPQIRDRFHQALTTAPQEHDQQGFESA